MPVKQPPAPPPRVPPLPLAQLLQAAPSAPPPNQDAYSRPVNVTEKGGLPLEICAFAQGIYAANQHQHQLPQQKQDSKALQPGWGGQGK